MLRSPERLALLEIEHVIDLCLAAFPAKSVLDVGTGTGLFAESLLARGLRVSGIDANPAMIEAARSLVPQARFRHASAEAVPYDDGAFDLAFMGLVLHETDDRLQALREVRRVARLGTAVLEWPYRQTEYGPPLADRLKPEELAALAQDAGFSRVETLSLSHLILYLLTGHSGRKGEAEGDWLPL
jgi:SAM-dependent methyltransferase